MLRLPPALRDLLAARVFRNHVWSVSTVSPALTSRLARRHGPVLLPRRRHATATPDDPRSEDASPLSEDTAGSEPVATLASRAANIMRDLRAGPGDVDDAVYDAIEEELLLAFHEERDPIEALRVVAIAQPDIPASLYAKITARLGDADAEGPPNEWLNLPEVSAFLQSETVSHEQKTDAKRLLGAIWSERSAFDQNLQGKVDAQVAHIMTMPNSPKALAKLFVELPSSARQCTGPCDEPGDHAKFDQREDQRNAPQTQDSDFTRLEAAALVEDTPGHSSDRVLTEPVAVKEAARDLTFSEESAQNSLHTQTNGLGRGAAERTSEAEPTPPSSTEHQAKQGEEPSRSTEALASRSGQAAEKEQLLKLLEEAKPRRKLGQDRDAFEKAIDRARRGPEALENMRTLVSQQKSGAGVSLQVESAKARLMGALAELEQFVEAGNLATEELDEARWLLGILRSVNDLLNHGASPMEVLVRAVEFAQKSRDRLRLMRLIALEYSSMPEGRRLRTCFLLKESGLDTEETTQLRRLLAQLYLRPENEFAQPTKELHLRDVNWALVEYPPPAKEDLPLASPLLWNPTLASQVLQQRCRQVNISATFDEQWSETPIKRPVGGRQRKGNARGPQCYYTCSLTANVTGICHESSCGDALGKTEAKRAAYYLLVSKMHTTGALAKLFSTTPTDVEGRDPGSDPAPAQLLSADTVPAIPLKTHQMTASMPLPATAADPRETTSLLDVAHIQSACELPSKDQYPNAQSQLFDASKASPALHSACGQVKLSIDSEASYTRPQGWSGSIKPQRRLKSAADPFRCDLKVSLGDLTQEIAHGEGLSKQAARQAAWLHVLSKLHVSGALAEIIPGSNVDAQIETEHRKLTEKAADAAGNVVKPLEEEDLELATVNADIMEEEKDAKIEIYNYAAGLGLVPRFETEAVQPLGRRGRIKARTKRSKLPIRASIKLDELSVIASATGADLQTAEVAAALAFKDLAEARHLSKPDGGLDESFRVLNTDTAKQFFTYCNERGVRMALEMELTQPSSTQGHQASLSANGRQIGQTVTLRKKKDAQAVAYLTGALEVARQHQQLLREFHEALKKGNGRLLTTLKTVPLELDPAVPQTMRNALAEAHVAGLPATPEVLLAERVEPDEALKSGRRPLDNLGFFRAQQRLARDKMMFDTDRSLQALRDKKAELPMSQYKGDVLGMVNNNAYSVIVGATGSGKTTQVPQILFEEAIRSNTGPDCNIICTQPRRIAATSVARRVAEERNESLRKTVGYQVRFDYQRPYNPYGITYCTTGILLERMKHDADGVLDSTSHILIDEVHERDLTIDFLMIVLKKAIHARQAEGKKVPRVVLMSATLDTELFSNYFKQPDQEGSLQPAPCLSVPGRTFPVKEKYLGSVMAELIKTHGAGVTSLIEADADSKDFLRAETQMSSVASGRADVRKDSVIDWKRTRSSILESDDEPSEKDEREEALVPAGLLATTVAHICATTPNDGAVLAFLPGLEEIISSRNALLQAPIFGMDFNDTSKFKVCLLHSTLPKEEQQEIFEAPPPGCRKIILSTNLAETSVTVTDVKYVVDTGKMREVRYDQLRRITKLQCVWVSKSNSKQRMGRAGRVQDGFYYALFSKERADSLRAIGLPEVLRTDLQETCLSISAQKFNEPIASFLAQAIEPPSDKAVDAAVSNLAQINAFTTEEDLTALGRVLSSLPVHPTLGKMIILGAIFKCLDPMIALGAAAGERSLLVHPFMARAEASKIHSEYAGKTASDQLAFLAAFKELRKLRAAGGMNAAATRARQRFLHVGAFVSIDRTAQQIVDILVERGLVARDSPSSVAQYGPADLNTNSNHSGLIKCLLLAGSYPNLAIKTMERSVGYRSATEGHSVMYPGSVNAERGGKQGPPLHPKEVMFAYSTLARSNDGAKLFMRDTTMVTPLMAMLFGGPLRMTEQCALEMDGWLPFAIKGFNKEFNTKLTLEFRKALERVLQRAYASLADVGQENDGGGFKNDPIREKFTQRVVELLGAGSPGNKNAADKWKDGW